MKSFSVNISQWWYFNSDRVWRLCGVSLIISVRLRGSGEVSLRFSVEEQTGELQTRSFQQLWFQQWLKSSTFHLLELTLQEVTVCLSEHKNRLKHLLLEPHPSPRQDYLASLSCLATVRISLAPLLSSNSARSTPSRSARSWASAQILVAVTPTRWSRSSTPSDFCHTHQWFKVC